MINWEEGYRLYNVAREAMNHGDCDRAAELFRQSARMAPHFKTFELLGECLIRSRKFEEAVVALAASVGLGTKPFRGLYLLAQALHEIGSDDWALRKLDEALAIKPDYKAAKEFRSTIALR